MRYGKRTVLLGMFRGTRRMNVCIFSGNLGSDIDVRYTPNGKCIGQFSLPVKSGWGDNEKVAWFRCKILGERAEKLSPYLTKGSQVTVQGRFELEEWEKSGVKCSAPALIVSELVLPPQNSQSVTKPVQKTANKPVPNEDFANDDIPF